MAKFKDVLDALEAGKRVRRKHWTKEQYIEFKRDAVRDEQGQIRDISGYGLLTDDDWEIVEPTVTITRKEFDEAVTKVQHSAYLYFSSSKEAAAIDMPNLRRNLNNI